MRYSRPLFLTAFAALFAALAVGAPAARSQSGPISRMTTSHGTAQGHFGLLDPSQTPSPTGGDHVGRFLQGTTIGVQLREGHPYPDQTEPDYLYGYANGGQSIVRVSRAGLPIDSTSFSGIFQSISGAWLVKSAVPTTPHTVPSGYDLKDHYVIVGPLSSVNPNAPASQSAMMMIDPATMIPYAIGLSTYFHAPVVTYEDVCFGVYPGPDADYATIDDNQYRYVTAFSTNASTEGGLFCLSLDKHQSMNGVSPPPDFDPVQPTRGPGFTNVYPSITSNVGTDTESFTAEDNGLIYCRSWYARPGLAGFSRPTGVTYVIAGWTQLYYTLGVGQSYYGPAIRGYTLGNVDPISPVTPQTGPPGGVPAPDNNFGQVALNNAAVFHSMQIVGDWLICALGPELNGDGYGAYYQAVYIPEFIDGAADGDNGVRFSFTPTGRAGTAGFHPSYNGSPLVTYLGTGVGQSIIYGTLLSPFQNHQGNSGLLNNPTPIDMHTEDEKLLGMNVRQEPQPFVGYWVSEDPAATFPGASSGGSGKGGGGCGGSVGGGGGNVLGLVALMGLVGLLVRTLKA